MGSTDNAHTLVIRNVHLASEGPDEGQLYDVYCLGDKVAEVRPVRGSKRFIAVHNVYRRLFGLPLIDAKGTGILLPS